MGTPLRRILALAIAAFGLVTPVTAAPQLDDLFRRAIFENALVLQGNFVDDGNPGLKARLFGTADDESDFTISFSSGSGRVTLDNKRLDGDPVSVTVRPKPISPFAWSCSAVFKCLDKTAEVDFWTQGGVTNRAYLGDVWVIAGGENVMVTSPPEPPDGGRFVVFESPTCSPVVACLPEQRADPLQKQAPTLAWKFGMAVAKKLQRPVETHIISSRHARYSSWFRNSTNWLPLFGWEHKHELTIGTRGIVWWWGEWEAEYGGFPNPLPNEPRATAAGWATALSDWEQTQSKAFQNCLTSFTAMTAGTPTPDSDDSAQVKQLTLVVQLQGVNRQPEHLKLFGFEKEGASSWELFRASQNEAVLALREKRTLGDGVFGIGSEKIRPRAAIVPAMQSPSNSFPNKWFWESADIGRLADELAATAYRHLGPGRTGDFEIGSPTVDWKDSKTVTINFKGKPTVIPPAARPELAQLEYSTADDPDSWATFRKVWSESITISVPNKIIRAVRYGAGNAPLLQYCIIPGTNRPSVTIPTFEFFRP